MRYAELHAKTNFSFLEGASHPDELVCRAAELGYAALAITDRNSLAGVVRAHGAAKDVGLKLLIGAEITPEDAPAVVLLATDRAAYGRLSRLITLGRRRAEKGECRLCFADIAQHAAGLIAAIKGQGWGDRVQGSGFGVQDTGAIRLAADGTSAKSDDCKLTIANCRLQIEGGEGRKGDGGRSRETASGTIHHPPSTNHHPPTTIHQPLSTYRDVFADRCYLLAELHHGPDDRRRLEQLAYLGRQAGVPLVAAGDVHYHVPERGPLCDVLTAIRYGCTVATAGEYLFPNAQRYLRTPAEIAAQFADVPEALRHTVEIAGRCTFVLDELRYEYPEELAPPGQTLSEYLARLAWAGARKRYPRGVPEKVRQLLDHELKLIAELHYEAYFLTVWDVVRFARRQGILCQGRGSAANSAVCYCLGITAVDPERMDVLFERFVSRERDEAPDIDVDFEHERREEVLQYLYQKYGRERAGMTAEVITYRPRSAVRDVGKALGLSPDRLDALAKRLEHFREAPDLCARCREAGIDPVTPLGRQLVELVGQLAGFPRHLSQHTGGMVMTRGPLCELVPIENAAMPERTVIQWNKDDLDELGILKVDCLALGMLTAIRKCFALVEQHHGKALRTGEGVRGGLSQFSSDGAPTEGWSGTVPLRSATVGASPVLTLANIPEGDEEVYAMIRRADTMGVFQIESRAQMSMLPRLRPRCFYDLVIEVAIVRPGPIQGNMVHPYLRRRNGEEAVTYPNEAIRRVLEKTLGVPLFQEQAMRLAVEAAGFTPGEADQLRRAMGAWRRPGLIDQFRKKLIDGMRERGFSEAYAEAVFGQIRGFGDYGFPESHAASFALLVYVSAWLKCRYPAAFTAALLNSQPMGFYAPAQLVRNAREHGVEVLPVDVNYSHGDCTLEAGEQGTGTVPIFVAGRHKNGTVPFGAPCGFAPDGKLQIANCKLQIEPQHLAADGTSAPSSLAPRPSPLALRLGLNMLHGLASAHAKKIVAARGGRPFSSLEDFARRTGLSRAVLSRLAKAGAFGSLRLDRRTALWHALSQDQTELPLFDGRVGTAHQANLSTDITEMVGNAHPTAEAEPVGNAHPTDNNSPLPLGEGQGVRAAVPLPPMSPAEEVLADYRTTGLSLRAHPLEFLRTRLDALGVVPAERLKTWPNNKPVGVAGIVLVRQRPGTAKGITFVTLEDETATANLIIRPHVWKRYHTAALGATLMLARGRLERHGEVIHVLCTKLEDLSGWMKDIASQSRDFC